MCDRPTAPREQGASEETVLHNEVPPDGSPSNPSSQPEALQPFPREVLEAPSTQEASEQTGPELMDSLIRELV